MHDSQGAAASRFLEIVIVVAILAILAGFVVPLLYQYAAQGRDTAARASLVQVRDAIMGAPDKPGYLADTGQLPTTLKDPVYQSVSDHRSEVHV